MTAIKANAGKAKGAKALAKKAKVQAPVEVAAEAKLLAEGAEMDRASGVSGSIVPALGTQSVVAEGEGGSGGGLGSGALVLGALVVAGGAAAAAAGGGDEVIVTPPPPPPPPPPAPTYAVSAANPTTGAAVTSVDEGATVRFNIEVKNATQPNQSYQITGIDADDLVDPSKLTGSVVIGSDGKGYVDIAIKADKLTEATVEKLKMTVGSASAEITVNDTSKTPDPATLGVPLTVGKDVLEANLFSSERVMVPGTGFVNTLDDDDVLTGAGTNPTLNVAFGAENDISDSAEVQPELNGVQTINAEWQNGDTTDLNLADADDALATVNVDRISSANGSRSIAIDDIGASVTNLSVGDEVSGGNLTFDYREDELTGDEELNLDLDGARLNVLTLSEGGDSNEDEGYFFETVNIDASGTTDIDVLTIAANEADAGQALNITAGAAAGASGDLEINQLNASGVDTMSIVANQDVVIAFDPAADLSGEDGLDTASLEQLTIEGGSNVRIDGLGGAAGLTVSAGALTGDLRVGVEAGTSSDAEFSLTSGAGDDEIVLFGDLGGDLVTYGGVDQVSFGGSDTDLLHTASINTGADDDTVAAGDLQAGFDGVADANDRNEASNGGFDDVTAASIVTGTGDDTVTVGVLHSEADWDNLELNDANSDDVYKMIGATVSTGDDADTVTVEGMEENTTVDLGGGADVFTMSLDTFGLGEYSVLMLASDSVAENELSAIGVEDVDGAVLDLGSGNDVANFVQLIAGGSDDVVILGDGAKIKGGSGTDEISISALDGVILGGLEGDITGIETLNLTIQNQIDVLTSSDTDLYTNDENETDGQITVDVAAFDDDLATINLISQEKVLLQNAAQEVYEAGTATEFTIDNLREGIEVNLSANEVTNVASDGEMLADDEVIDVFLNVDMTSAEGDADSFVLNVKASNVSGANDADLSLELVDIENATINLQAGGSHYVNLNGFGDETLGAGSDDANLGTFEQWRNQDPVNHVSVTTYNLLTAAQKKDFGSGFSGDTSFTLTGTVAGEAITVDDVTADVISVTGASDITLILGEVTNASDGASGTFGNRGNNYDITTGSGDDTLVMLNDLVDDEDSIDGGQGANTLVIDGSNGMGFDTVDDAENDEVWANKSNIQTLELYAEGGSDSAKIVLDEEAFDTGIETITLTGASDDDQVLNLVIGEDFRRDFTINADDELLGFANITYDNRQDAEDITLTLNLSAVGGAAFELLDAEDRVTTDVSIVIGSDGVASTVIGSGAANADGEVQLAIDNQLLNSITLLDNGSDAADINLVVDSDWSFGTLTIDASDVLNVGGNIFNGAAESDAILDISGTLSSDTITGGSLGDTLEGNGGNDVIDGGLGSDTISGGAGSDDLTGNLGDDTISGGDGSDTIDGGLGADDLAGGDGQDTFVYDAASDSYGPSIDTIDGFVGGTVTAGVTNGDLIDLSGLSDDVLGGFSDVDFVGMFDTQAAGESALISVSDDDLGVFFVRGATEGTGTLYVDVNGDGDINAGDMIINFTSYTGTLTDANFVQPT